MPQQAQRDAETRPDSRSGYHPTSTRSEQATRPRTASLLATYNGSQVHPIQKLECHNSKNCGEEHDRSWWSGGSPQGRSHTSLSAQPKSNTGIDICSFLTSPRIVLHLAMPSGGSTWVTYIVHHRFLSATSLLARPCDTYLHSPLSSPAIVEWALL
jgi:hypothetical protein